VKPLGQRNYEGFAHRYAEGVATKPYNAYYDRPNTLSLVPDIDGRRVLDAGCGPGVYAEELLARGADLVAVDVTPEMVEIARTRVGDRATVRQANLMERLDFAGDGEFDAIVCALVLDYIEDWRPVFREFHRILRPGGVLVYSHGHPQSDYLYLRDKRAVETSYFEVELHGIPWTGWGEPNPTIEFYRRPLAETLNPIAEAGLVFDRLLEAKPTEEFRRARPEAYEKLMREPCFLCVRARKPE